jgi:truncated hemoglobin YjbI
VAEPSDFERIGGEPVLRRVIDAFVDRCFDDMMIGFHFRAADRERVKRFEYQHAASFFGADVAYEGRPLTKAHGAHNILGGQFMRRRQILLETARAHGLPADVIERWLAHQDSLRGEITQQVGSGCDD